MSDAAGFAALALWVGSWAAFAYVGRKNGWTWWIRHGGGFVVGLFALVLGVIMFAPGTSPTSTASKPAPVAAESKSAAIEKKAGLKISKELFAYRWNSISQNKIGAIDFTGKVANIRLGESHALILNSLTDEHDVDGAVLMFAPQTAVDALDALINVAAIIGATNPDLTPAQRGEIMKRLRMTGDDADYQFANNEHARRHVVGQVKYYFMRIADVVMFGAEVPD